MAAADQQFLDALKFLGQQGQEYGIKRQMDQVNQRAEEIRSTMKNEIDRRQALRNLAQQASLSVSGSGGNAQQQAAINNLIPPIPKSVQETYLQGSLTGDRQMVEVAKQMMDEDERRQIALEERKAAVKLKLSENEEDKLLRRDAIQNGRKEAEKLTEALKSGKEFQLALTEAQKAYQGGTFVGTGPLDQFTNRLTDQGNVLRQKFGQLNMLAKLHVAKLSGARAADTEGEQKAILESLPNEWSWEGANDRTIADRVKDLDKSNFKMEAALYSLQRSGFTSPTAYAHEYRREGDRRAVSDRPAEDGVRKLFK